MLPPTRTDARTGTRLLTIANRQTQSLAMTWLMATGLVATSGCVAIGIPSKRFHDPQDHGGLFGDFRKGGASGMPDRPAQHDGHFCDGTGVAGQCTQRCCAGAGGHDGHFDEQDGWGDGGHGHSKAPEVPWPRYHPVPTRPVFSGYPGMQP
jgi:hypothetical protein